MGPFDPKILYFLPFLFLAWNLARLLSPGRPLPWTHALVWTLVAMTLLPMCVGGAGENFAGALRLASVLAVALGLLAWIYSRVLAPFFMEPRKENRRWVFFALVGLSAVLVGLVGFKVSIHDETSIQSHPAVIERILRYGLPVGLSAFFDIPLKYHYGFNVLAAVFAYCLDLPAWQAIDVVHVLLWVAACLALGSLLRTLNLGPTFRGLALLWILLGAGWMWWERPEVWQHSYYYGRHMKPMLLSWFFQHPVALGLPLFFLGMEYWIRFRATGRPVFFAAAALLTGVLSFAQVVLFGGLLFGIGVDLLKECWRRRPNVSRPVLLGLAFAVISLGLAFHLGGFFTAHPAYQGDLTAFSWPPGFLRNEYFSRSPLDWRQSAEWYLLNFGSPLILFPLATWLAWRRGLAALTVPVAMAVVGFLIPQFLQYKLSWDVMKFFLLFDLSARLVIAAVFLPMLGNKLWAWALAGTLLLSSMVGPLSFLWKLGFTERERLPYFAKELIGAPHAPAVGEYSTLLLKLRETPVRGHVLANPGLSRLATVYAGQSVLAFDRNTVAFGVREDLLEDRRKLTEELWRTLSYRRLKEAGVKWVLWPCQDENRFSAEAKSSKAEEIASGAFGSYVFSDSPETCVRGLEVH